MAYQPGDVLLFGPEPTGLAPEVLADAHVTDQVRIPMLAGRRSLNLANSAAVACYEAWRQHGFAGSRDAGTRDAGSQAVGASTDTAPGTHETTTGSDATGSPSA